ncbi:MAG: M23 family metallopeptidase [Bryobacteraceae bacterium]|nr:M23 family metallopeptidase [Bryobacteraceae bacterium]
MRRNRVTFGPGLVACLAGLFLAAGALSASAKAAGKPTPVKAAAKAKPRAKAVSVAPRTGKAIVRNKTAPKIQRAASRKPVRPRNRRIAAAFSRWAVANPAFDELPPMVAPLSDLTPSDLQNSFFHRRRSGLVHYAIDIFRPIGAPLLAVVDGVVEKIHHNRLGGATLYLADETRNYRFYYAHLDGYAPGIAEGQAVRRGDVIGYVGNTGNARYTSPHLHFQILKARPEEGWWKHAGILNPFPLLTELLRRELIRDSVAVEPEQ